MFLEFDLLLERLELAGDDRRRGTGNWHSDILLESKRTVHFIDGHVDLQNFARTERLNPPL